SASFSTLSERFRNAWLVSCGRVRVYGSTGNGGHCRHAGGNVLSLASALEQAPDGVEKGGMAWLDRDCFCRRREPRASTITTQMGYAEIQPKKGNSVRGYGSAGE